MFESILSGLMFLGLAMCLLRSFANVRSLVKIEREKYKDEWIKDGRPYGFNYEPHECGYIESSFATHRVSFAWLFQTPQWVENDVEATVFIKALRRNVLIWNVGILVWFALSVVPSICNGAESYQPFIAKQYPSDDFSVSQTDFKHGNVLIGIIEAKRISKKYDEQPYLCRTWLEVKRSNKAIYQKYFDDIDSAAFSYGLFIPKKQPPSPYFAVVKNGDYDGRLFLVSKDGKVFDLMGGFYFITGNKRYLFSSYASDASGLVVFDLLAGRVVFSSDKLPGYEHQWYTKDGDYYFTASAWDEKSGMPHEKAGTAYCYDFKAHKIIEKRISSSEIADSKKVVYDFDPRGYEDCKVTQSKRIDGD